MKKPRGLVKMGKPDDKKNTTFRISASLMRQARLYALSHNTSVTQMIEQALRERLALAKEGR
jgi:hypothetical protein